MEKEDLFNKRMLELARIAYQREIVLFTSFLSLGELHMVKTITSKEIGITLETFGGYDVSERQIAAFVPDALSYAYSYPIKCLKVRPLSRKFSQNLSHRDYLGAVLNLGINRNKVGDILVMPNEAYVFCEDLIADFLLQELTSIKHTSVNCTFVEFKEEGYKPNYQEIIGTVASLRLDSVLGLAFQGSRSSMVPYIEAGKVYVNGKTITSNSYALKDLDLISLRGTGKVRFVSTLKNTKKGRCLIKLEKFI